MESVETFLSTDSAEAERESKAQAVRILGGAICDAVHAFLNDPESSFPENMDGTRKVLNFLIFIAPRVEILSLDGASRPTPITIGDTPVSVLDELFFVKPGLSRVSTNLRIWQSIVMVPQILKVLCVWYS